MLRVPQPTLAFLLMVSSPAADRDRAEQTMAAAPSTALPFPLAAAATAFSAAALPPAQLLPPLPTQRAPANMPASSGDRRRRSASLGARQSWKKIPSGRVVWLGLGCVHVSGAALGGAEWMQTALTEGAQAPRQAASRHHPHQPAAPAHVSTPPAQPTCIGRLGGAQGRHASRHRAAELACEGGGAAQSQVDALAEGWAGRCGCGSRGSAEGS